MRIKILSSAVEDLHLGRVFYENQGEGLGEYFLDYWGDILTYNNSIGVR